MSQGDRRTVDIRPANEIHFWAFLKGAPDDLTDGLYYWVLDRLSHRLPPNRAFTVLQEDLKQRFRRLREAVAQQRRRRA